MSSRRLVDHRWFTLAILCFVQMLVFLDNTILNVTLPTLVREIGATPAQLQWIVDTYILSFAGFLLASGSLGDRYGRKGVMTIGMVVFGIASVGGAMSKGAIELIAWRGVMGIGAALIVPATLSILLNVYTEGTERRRAIAWWTLMNAAGVFFGPVTGGLLLRHFWWGSVFVVNIPVVVAAILLGRWFVPTSRNPNPSRFDVVGAILSTFALASIVWVIIEAPGRGFTDPAIRVVLVVALVSLVGFVSWERRVAHPMLDLSAFSDPQLSAATAAMTVAFIAMSGSMFLSSQLLQLAKGYTPLAAALATSTPLVVVNFIVVPRAPKLIERFGARRMVTAGVALIGCSALVLTLTTVESGYINIFVGFALMALAFSSFVPAATEIVVTSMPASKAGAASAINQMTRQLGQALGVAVSGSIAAWGYSSSFPALALPDAKLATARSSITGAVRVSRELGGSAAATVVDAASRSFLTGARLALGTAAAIAALCAFFATRALRPKNEPTAASPTDLTPEADRA